ncbi:T9SS type A sorting domain-containing protein [candidate division KSB1 bacterium]|nr:T9SS type A sorting domain-containing protein [candidate division KSB1 bacterium]
MYNPFKYRRGVLQPGFIIFFLACVLELYAQGDKAPVLLVPRTRSFINTRIPTFVWKASSDEALTYRLVVAEKSGKAVVDMWIERTNQYRLADSLALKDLSIYYWNVSAFDGENYYPSDDFSFWVDLNISLDLELRYIKLLNPRDNWEPGDVAEFEVEVLNAGELPCYTIDVILYNGNFNQNYVNERSYRPTERADQKTLSQIDSGQSARIHLRARVKSGYNRFSAEVRTTGDYKDVLLFNNFETGPLIQTIDKRLILNGLYIIFDKYGSESIQEFTPQDLNAIYSSIESARQFFWDHTSIIDMHCDTHIMNTRLLNDEDFIYIDEKWGYVLSPDKIITRSDDLQLPLFRYDFVYVFYPWENTNRSWTGYRGYTYGTIKNGINQYALAAQPIKPGMVENKEIIIHEILRIMSVFYESKGITNFHPPDQREQNTTFSNNIDYYAWILETWPSSNWFSLGYGETVPQVKLQYADQGGREQQVQLFQNYPNPFNNFTTIRYLITEDSSRAAEYSVSVSIYSVLGEKVRTLLNGNQKPGIHSLLWDGKNDQDEFVPSGIYLYNLKINDLNLVKKLIFIK